MGKDFDRRNMKDMKREEDRIDKIKMILKAGSPSFRQSS
jgi:hypothetical protein